MNEPKFYILIFLSLGVMGLTLQFQSRKGPDANRPMLAIAFILGAILMWLSCGPLLGSDPGFAFFLNLASVMIFFVGLALFVPKPPRAIMLNEHRLAGHIVIWTGIILGSMNGVALMFTEYWPIQLFAVYRSLGLT
jgi:predicted membrane channel-forming protein YqfA (hemolysin III family)